MKDTQGQSATITAKAFHYQEIVTVTFHIERRRKRGGKKPPTEQQKKLGVGKNGKKRRVSKMKEKKVKSRCNEWKGLKDQHLNFTQVCASESLKRPQEENCQVKPLPLRLAVLISLWHPPNQSLALSYCHLI